MAINNKKKLTEKFINEYISTFGVSIADREQLIYQITNLYNMILDEKFDKEKVTTGKAYIKKNNAR